MKEWKKTALILGMALMIGFSLRLFVFDIVRVHGDSMVDTIHDGDRLVMLKPITPHYGDIVVVKAADGRHIIKRVIGLDGDVIDIKDNQLFRNGKAIDETYLPEPMKTEDVDGWKVGAGELYVLGDNRNLSADSRMYGNFPSDSLRGVVKARLWPGLAAY